MGLGDSYTALILVLEKHYKKQKADWNIKTGVSLDAWPHQGSLHWKREIVPGQDSWNLGPDDEPLRRHGAELVH